MARVNTVEKSLKSPGTCGKCNKQICKGEGYRWWAFRYGGGGKRVRCLDASCRPRQSELTQSDKLSRVYSVSEAMEDAIEAFREDKAVEDLKSALTDGAEQLREVAQEYRDSAESIESGMNNRMPVCDELEEKADVLEGVADEMESAESNLPEREGEDPEEMDEDKIKELLDEEHGDLDDYCAGLLREEDSHFDDLKQEGQDEKVTNKIDELVEAKRDELKTEWQEETDRWVDEVAGEVEQFTSIEVG
jgi:peptidoglycan hydrolase CwlO-like protein